MPRTEETLLRFAARRPGHGDILAIVTSRPDPKAAMAACRKRWAIENLFGDIKTRGLNMEDTHMTDPRKLDTLLSIIALATAWAYRCTTQTSCAGT